MRWLPAGIAILSTASLLPCCWGRKQENEASKDKRITFSKLSPPTYPPLARLAHISGEVKLEVRVRLDGSVESVSALGGPPMLIPASVDSAKNSLFACGGCDEAKNAYTVTYEFKLISEDDPCAVDDQPKEAISRSDDHITVTSRTQSTCDPAVRSARFRSAKCLYLWKCGRIEFQ